MNQPIYVENNLFLGRAREQREFRAALRDLLDSSTPNDKPYVALIYGDGGMGKTTLSKRFRDIALLEQPFEQNFEEFRIDWEIERTRNAGLQGGRENVRPETVFDLIHANAIAQEWGHHFSAYQKIKQQRGTVEKAAAAALSNELQGKLSPLRGFGADALAQWIRTKVPMGDTGEEFVRKTANLGIELAIDQASHLHMLATTHLQARLKPEQFQIFMDPERQIALALADGLRRVAKKKRLLVCLDTYEIIDAADAHLRVVIQAGGGRIFWVISGRNNLARSRSYGGQWFVGYEAEFPSSQLLAYDLPELALEDVQAYFADRAEQLAEDRPLDHDEAVAISRATRGIPLAIKVAAEMWEKGVTLAEIVGAADNTTIHREIVQQMTGRYLLHTVKESDRQGLYALALAAGKRPLLQAMLRPDDPVVGAAFNLNTTLDYLQRAYASVHLEEARLHDEPTDYLQAFLRTEAQRTDPLVASLYERAVAHLRQELAELEEEISRIEERHEDEEWVEATLLLTHYLFGVDERKAWQWLVPRFVECLVYNREVQHGLLDVATVWSDSLSRRGKRRLKNLTKGLGEIALLLDELQKLKGWLAGDGETERKAILLLQQGKLHFESKDYGRAWKVYQQVEHNLPEESVALKNALGEAMYTLAGKLLWPDSSKSAVRSDLATTILAKVVTWLPEKQEAWYRYGVGFYYLGQYDDAIEFFQKAIELDPTLAHPHNGLGNVYTDHLGQYDEALNAYQKAIELDPTDAYPNYGLGNVYRHLGQYDDALNAYQKAIELDLTYASPHNGLGNVYYHLGQYDDAINAYQKVIEFDPTLAHPHNGLGNVYDDLGQYDDALNAYQKAIELDLTYASPHNGLGCVYHHLGQYNDAINTYQKAIELDPTDALPHYGLGNVYRQLGQYDEALNAYQKAIELEPKLAVVHISLATCYRKSGQEELYRQQVTLAREFIASENDYNRACFEAICGNVAEAVELLTSAIANAPGLQQSAGTDPDFDFIRDDPRFQALIGSGR